MPHIVSFIFNIIFSLLSPVIRISSLLSSLGVDFSWFGLPNYAFGSVIICDISNFNIEYAMVPLPSISNSAFLVAIGKDKMKYIKKNNNIEEYNYLNVNLTADHRFFDGSYGSKLISQFKNLYENMNENLLKSK